MDLDTEDSTIASPFYKASGIGVVSRTSRLVYEARHDERILLEAGEH